MGGEKEADLGDYDEYDMYLTDQGARALGSLVRLTHLNISGVDISDEGVRALSSLTALTYLDMSDSKISSEEGVKALTCLTTLTDLRLRGVLNLGDE
jgi:hypothetical protein